MDDLVAKNKAQLAWSHSRRLNRLSEQAKKAQRKPDLKKIIGYSENGGFIVQSTDGSKKLRRVITNGALPIGKTVAETTRMINAMPRVKLPVAVDDQQQSKKYNILYLYWFLHTDLEDPEVAEIWICVGGLNRSKVLRKLPLAQSPLGGVSREVLLTAGFDPANEFTGHIDNLGNGRYEATIMYSMPNPDVWQSAAKRTAVYEHYVDGKLKYTVNLPYVPWELGFPFPSQYHNHNGFGLFTAFVDTDYSQSPVDSEIVYDYYNDSTNEFIGTVYGGYFARISNGELEFRSKDKIRAFNTVGIYRNETTLTLFKGESSQDDYQNLYEDLGDAGGFSENQILRSTRRYNPKHNVVLGTYRKRDYTFQGVFQQRQYSGTMFEEGYFIDYQEDGVAKSEAIYRETFTGQAPNHTLSAASPLLGARPAGEINPIFENENAFECALGSKTAVDIQAKSISLFNRNHQDFHSYTYLAQGFSQHIQKNNNKSPIVPIFWLQDVELEVSFYNYQFQFKNKKKVWAAKPTIFEKIELQGDDGKLYERPATMRVLGASYHA